jgi:hypothetical protein
MVRLNALFFLRPECKIQANHLIQYGEVIGPDMPIEAVNVPTTLKSCVFLLKLGDA